MTAILVGVSGMFALVALVVWFARGWRRVRDEAANQLVEGMKQQARDQREVDGVANRDHRDGASLSDWLGGDDE